LFSWVGIKQAAIFFAIAIVLKEVVHLFFLLRLEKRIFKPMEKLKQGLDEVAKGNYNVKLEYDKPNDLGLLMTAFNTMTEKLYAGEKLQTEYEDNRKALVANISHDLKTPITAIQGYIEALIEGKVSTEETQSKYLRTIYHNIIYVNKLIDDLFLFSKLDMQKLDLHVEHVQIKPLMEYLMEEYTFDLAEQKISFQYSAHLDTDYWLDLDIKRFHQAINNLINNAVKHGPDINLAIEVKLYHQDNSVLIDIKDNGPGIAQDKLPFIFDRFYRVDVERTRDYSGTGLGLAIAKELVEAQHGKISVSSRKQAGTCFTLIFPMLPKQ